METKDWTQTIAYVVVAVAFLWQMKVNVATLKVLVESVIERQNKQEARADVASDAIHRYETDLMVGKLVHEQMSKDIDRLSTMVEKQVEVTDKTKQMVQQIFFHLNSVADHAGHPRMEDSTPS